MSIAVNTLIELAQKFAIEPETAHLSCHNGSKRDFDCLVEFIGSQRLQRICHHPEINLNYDALSKRALPLDKPTLRKIFIGLLDIRIEDWNSSGEAAFCPFKNRRELELLFLNRAPAVDDFFIDKARSSGKGLQGLAERVYLQGLHHLKIEKGKSSLKEARLRDAEFLTSRLADREIQEGMIIHLSEGYFAVDRIFIGGGAYVAALRSIDTPDTVKLVCRGTAMRKSATGGLLSGINDLQLEVGLMGVKSIWPALGKYLVERPIQQLEVLGKSLGGAHAQQLVVLIEGAVRIPVHRLTTCGSVGVSANVYRLFQQVRAGQSHSLKITILRNGDKSERDLDHVPCVGGSHLGLGGRHCQIKVHYLSRERGSALYTGRLSFAAQIMAFIKSFSEAHCRQMTLKKFTWTTIKEPDALKEQLLMGNRLECWRKALASIIHIFTFGLLNGLSFEPFFHKLAKEGLGD